MEERLAGPEGLLVHPERPRGTGVLVLSGSSGRIDEDRARLFAAHGATALAARWFGGKGQQPGPFEVPLEVFVEALDLLAPQCDRLAVCGLSFGAEAALLTAAHDSRVAATVALAPSSVVWAGVDAGVSPARQTSHWTRAGSALPFVPFVDDWRPDQDPPAFVDLYRASLQAFPDRVAEAAIPVERIAGPVVLIAGGDDQVWPSEQFARDCAARRSAHGMDTTVITHPEAGHRVRLPGEPTVTAGSPMARGGTSSADAECGERAWPHIVAAFDLTVKKAGPIETIGPA